MLFSKTLLVLLVAILGTSWIPDGRTNGLASACRSSVNPPAQCEEKKDPTIVPKGGTTKVCTIDDIPEEGDDFAPWTAGIWIENKYYRLPNAPFYQVKIKKGKEDVSTEVGNPYYRGPINMKD